MSMFALPLCWLITSIGVFISSSKLHAFKVVTMMSEGLIPSYPNIMNTSKENQFPDPTQHRFIIIRFNLHLIE